MAPEVFKSGWTSIIDNILHKKLLVEAKTSAAGRSSTTTGSEWQASMPKETAAKYEAIKVRGHIILDGKC